MDVPETQPIFILPGVKAELFCAPGRRYDAARCSKRLFTRVVETTRHFRAPCGGKPSSKVESLKVSLVIQPVTA